MAELGNRAESADLVAHLSNVWNAYGDLVEDLNQPSWQDDQLPRLLEKVSVLEVQMRAVAEYVMQHPEEIRPVSDEVDRDTGTRQ